MDNQKELDITYRAKRKKYEEQEEELYRQRE